MSLDVERLVPLIRQILSAPGTDLTTISAKRVRRQLLDADATLTPELLKENKDAVDRVIASVFEAVSTEAGVGGDADDADEYADTPDDADEPPAPLPVPSRKRKVKDEDEDEQEFDDAGEDEPDERAESGTASPPAKKAKKVGKGARPLSDEEIARQLSSEINGRARRSGAVGRPRGTANGAGAKKGRKKKSAATVDSDGESGGDGEEKEKPKPKKKAGSGAKGGFAKEYALSEPLAAVLNIDKLSRPQVVKHLWEYIKGNELQNPSNKREIVCDANLKAVFNVDKIDMFKMNKVLGQHLLDAQG